ncbi:MAG: bifunctional phosphopantothenoylcysteine decarboxylase/phosphopantothenate--cysteine ligase CoaBC [Thermodesulfobacteriota bacterium]
MQSLLEGKHIVLGVSGGIAAYKSVELLRLLQKAGADVKVVMTKNAAWFVGPMTFEAISGHPVFMEMFGEQADPQMRHISWAEEADAVVIAPATADVIGKLANGIADDALTTFMLAVTAPKMICPAMNTHMYENRAVQRNIDVLESDGYRVVEPGAGELACKTVGPGRLEAPEMILERIIDLFSPMDFSGKKVVVTAGPTQESIDPVRFISNPSTGKMGYAVARAAAARGADVLLVSGPTALEDPFGVRVKRVQSVDEMAEAVFLEADAADVIVKVAAVSDYRPASVSGQKIKKHNDSLVLELTKTKDILAELGERKKKGQVLVGFAAETEDLEQNAVKKMEAKHLDLIAGNLIGAPESGFAADTNKIRLFFNDGRSEDLPIMDKQAAANVLLDRIGDLIEGH